MIKVGILDKKLLKNYFATMSLISIIFSFISIAIDIPDGYKIESLIGLLIFFVVIYLIMWIMANYTNKASIEIGNSLIEIRVGDIFKEKDLKVIAFNEYFDTLVDDKIISSKTLNGIYINKCIISTAQLDEEIERDANLNNKIVAIDENRLNGKKQKYSIGTIYKKDDYLLTAFSKFDENNRAYLNMNDYMNFLINFWNEVDIIYAGRSVSIPLLGSGITRFRGYENISDQELLELLIWSFKVSRIKFTYPSKVSIIIHESKKDKINLFNLKGE